MESINRIKADLIIWQERENDQATLPQANIKDKGFLKEKLAYLDGIALRYKNNLSPDERLTLIHVDRMLEHIQRNSLSFLARFYRKLTTGSREKAIVKRQEDASLDVGKQMPQACSFRLACTGQ